MQAMEGEGGRLTVRLFARLRDIAPTGRRVVYVGAGFFRIADGRIVEHWHQHDALGLMRQLRTT